VKAIILAAGRGSRMGTLTTNLPKCRTVLFGKELIQWQIEALNHAGIEEIAIIRGYLKETFDFNVKYFDNTRWAKTNMVSTLVEANQWLKNETCVISYADIVYSKRSVSTLMESKSDIVITYDPNWLELWSMRFDNPLDDAETFKLDGAYVTEIGNSPDNIDQIEGQFMGLIKISPSGWAKIKEYLNEYKKNEVDSMDMTMLLQGLIASNIEVCAVPIYEKWMEVDTESDLKVYQKEYKKFFPNS